MEWLKLLYGAVGAEFPLLSLLLVAAAGGLVSGGAWWLVGREYRKTHVQPAELPRDSRSTAPSLGPSIEPQSILPIEGPANEARRASESTPKPQQESAQSVDNRGAVGSSIYQAGRDIVVQSQAASDHIRSIVLEVRLTCTLKAAHGELPPDEVTFMALGDSHAYLEGPAGRQRLLFASPVRFRRLVDGRIVVVNRFTLDPAGDLLNRPKSTLKNYSELEVPVVTVVWGGVFDRMTLLGAC